MKDLVHKLLCLELRSGGISKDKYLLLGETEKSLLESRHDLYYLKPQYRKLLKIVLTGGVFDVLHIGHILTLSEAKTYGDFLVVAIASDSHIKKKGREPIHPQEYRRIIVESIRYVDCAVSGFDDPKEMLNLVKPDMIVYGYDQKEFLKPEGVEIVKLSKKYDDSKFKSGKILEKLGV